MAYVASKNPGGKLPGWGWAPGLRGYTRSNNPGGPLPGWGWAANLRGAGSRYLGSGLRKIVVGGLGCACNEKTLSGLGQDSDTVSSVDVPTDPAIYTLPGFGTVLPAGVGYGPSQSGGVATYSASPEGSSGPYATPSDLPAASSGGGGVVVVNTSTTNSTWLWLIGGLAGFAALLEVSGKRR